MKTTIATHTQTTPSIELIDTTLTISGNAITIEPELFWALPLHQIKQHKNIDSVIVELNYVSSSSLPHIINLIKNIPGAAVTWICQHHDDDMIELGESLEYVVTNEFSIKY